MAGKKWRDAHKTVHDAHFYVHFAASLVINPYKVYLKRKEQLLHLL